MKYYPIILVPPAIYSAQAAYPPHLEYPEPRPELPQDMPKFMAIEPLLARTLVVLGFGFIIAIFNALGGLVWILVGVCLVWAVGLRQIKTYPRRYREFTQQLSVYQDRLIAYEKRQLEHEVQVQSQLTPYRQEKVYQILRQVRSFDRLVPETHVNPTALAFAETLRDRFGDNVFAGASLTNATAERSEMYVIDCVYCHRESNLHVAIEIDVPYTNKGTPTSYIESKTQQRRNRFLLDGHWLVIHFAEEQICRSPLSCCREIAAAIAQIIPFPIPETLPDDELAPFPRWDYASARRMALEDYRQTYLA